MALQEVESGRKQTIARLRGAGGGRSIMLNGHIDIDPLATGWTRDPFDPVGCRRRLHGPGGDVLGTRVLALTALEASA